MDENIKDSIRKFGMHKTSLSGTFLTDLTTSKRAKHSNLKRKDELDTCFYNIKKHYNDLLILKKENELIINRLTNEEKKLEKLISNMIEIKPNILSNTNISVEESKHPNYDNTNKVNDLLSKKKEEHNKKLLVETQYTISLQNMITNEKINFQNSEESYQQIKDKLRKLKLSMKYIDLNIQENSKRANNVNGMNKGVKDELEKMNQIILSQVNKLGYISFSLEKNKVEITEKRKLLDEKNVDLERETKIKKANLKNKIVEAEKMKLLKLNDENRISRIVLGLDLIKRYLIDGDKLNDKDVAKSLFDSQDYAYFKNIKFLFKEESKGNTSYSAQAKHKEEEMYSSFYLNNLKEKFNNLNIDYKEIFDFSTKIIKKQQFATEYMVLFNTKEIQLEQKKENYSRRVKEIIAKNSKNLNQIIQTNSRFQQVLNKFSFSSSKYNIPQKFFEMDLIDSNTNFYDKCKQTIQVVNRFLNFLLTYFEIGFDVKLSSNDFNVDGLEDSLKTYFEEISQNQGISSENLISYYFEDYVRKEDVCFEKILEIYPKYEIKYDKDPNINFINEQNKIMHFAHLKDFIGKNKTDFISINISYEKDIYFSLGKLDEYIPLLDRILRFCKELKEYKQNLKSTSLKDSSGDEKEDKGKKSIYSKYQPLVIKRSDSDKDSYVSDYHGVVVKKKQVKIVNNKMTSFLSKMYDPYIEKNNYLSGLNEGIGNIKKNTRRNLYENHMLGKKKLEIKQIKDEFNLFYNPKINLNSLSNNTYNTFVKNIISSQMDVSKKDLIKAKSSRNFYKKKIKTTKTLKKYKDV